MILRVDLTSGKIEKEPLPKDYREKYLGGNGYGVVELYKHLKEGPLIFAAGGMDGTIIPTANITGVFGISPLMTIALSFFWPMRQPRPVLPACLP